MAEQDWVSYNKQEVVGIENDMCMYVRIHRSHGIVK